MKPQTILTSAVLFLMALAVFMSVGAGLSPSTTPRIAVMTDTNGVLFDSASNLFASNLNFMQPYEVPFASNVVSGGTLSIAAAGRLTNHSDVTTAPITGGWLMWNGSGWTNFFWPENANVTNGFTLTLKFAGKVWSTNGFVAPDSTGTNWWSFSANPNMSTNLNWIGPTNPATGLIYGTNQLTGSATNVQLITLANGSANQVLMMVGGIPTWANVGAASSGPFTNLVAWSAPTIFVRTNGQVPNVIVVSNTATGALIWGIDGTGLMWGTNAVFSTFLAGTNNGGVGDVIATNRIIAATPGVGFVGDGSGLTNLSWMNHQIGGSVTNTILAGTNINTGDISYPRYPITTLANGNNEPNVGTNYYIQVSGPTGSFTNVGFAGGRDGKEIIIINQTGFDMDLANESGLASSAANRITCLTGADKKVTGNSAARLIYNGSTSRWVVQYFTQ